MQAQPAFRSWVVVALVWCLLILTACGGDDAKPSSTAAPPTSTTGGEPTAAPPTSTTGGEPTTGPETGAAVRFHSNGEPDGAWYWLRDAARAATAEWALPSLPSGPEDVSLDVTALATDAAGSRGLPAVFLLAYGTENAGGTFTQFDALPLVLLNTSAAEDPRGYTASARVILDRKTIPVGTSALVVRASRSAPGSEGVAAAPLPDTFVAFCADSVRLGPAPLPDTEVNADIYQGGDFSSDGDYIKGWWWLRDDAHSDTATWNYQAVPAGSFDVQIDFTVLATDRRSGDRGYPARFYVSYGPIPDARPLSQVPTQLVTLPNTSPPDDPVGYTCQGSLVIPRDSLPPGTDQIWLKMSRVDAGGANPVDLHIGFQQSSVVLVEGPINADGDSADDAVVITAGEHEGTLDGADSQDWYRFLVEPRQVIGAYANPPTGGSIEMTLLDPNLVEKATAVPDFLGVRLAHVAAAGAGGYWCLRITRTSGSGAYEFQVSIKDQNDGASGRDAGDTPATAFPLTDGGYVIGSLRGGSILLQDDPADVYRITLDPGQKADVTVANPNPDDPWSGASGYEVRFQEQSGRILSSVVTVDGTATVTSANFGTQAVTQYLVVTRWSGRGGPYDLTLTTSGASACDGGEVAAREFSTAAPQDQGLHWLADEANLLTATWLFGHLPPGSADLRLSLEIPIRHAHGEVGQPPEGDIYLLYGAIPGRPSALISGPQRVVLAAPEGTPFTVSGYTARAEIALPRQDLLVADQGFWVRLYRVDPALGERGRVTEIALPELGVAASSLQLCVGGQMPPSLPAPSSDPQAVVNFNNNHILASSTRIFVDPGSDLDGDGLNQNWENAAAAALNPLIEVDEEEEWLRQRASHRVVNFLRVYPWPSIVEPRYILFSYLVTWNKDYGAGLQDVFVKKEHDGDSERVLQAWKVRSDSSIQLEWVMTSAHHTVTDHSGVWHATDPQCNRGNLSDQWESLIGTELMCNWLEYEADGRLKIYAAEDKHGTYPGDGLCNAVRLVYITEEPNSGSPIVPFWWHENCGWDPYGPDQWEDADFLGDSRYRPGGQWLWTVFNAGEPDNYLINDLGDSFSWRGLTTEQVDELSGAFPAERVWTGWNGSGGGFCGGLRVDAWVPDLPLDAEGCSSRLGKKLEVTPDLLLAKLNARYRVAVRTEGEPATDLISFRPIIPPFIQLRDASGRTLAVGSLDGRFGLGQTEYFYLVPLASASGESVHSLVVSRPSPELLGEFEPEGLPWPLDSVEITDLVTGDVLPIQVDQSIEAGEQVTAP